ncbi:MAG: hypothetical protein ABII97_02430 [Patescibacteria group bacterium]
MKRTIHLNILLFFLILFSAQHTYAFEIKDKIRPPALGFTIEEKILPSDSNFKVIDKILPPQLELKVSDKIPAFTPVDSAPILTNSPSPKNSVPGKPKKRKSLEELIVLAKTDLAERLGIKIEEILVKSTTEKTWSDASLGCPEKGKYYTQVITPGYLIIFGTGERMYNYHTSLNWVMFCSLSEKINSANNRDSETQQNRVNTSPSIMTTLNLIGEKLKTSLGRFFLSNHQ